MTLVSVVIPAYNREKYIARAIRSIQLQGVSGIEIIVVDDCSQDGTMQAVLKCADTDPRIRLISLDKKKGAQAARNTAIRNARGQWIAFLDSDDEWLPDSLSNRLSVAKEQNVEVVHSACYKKQEPNPELKPFYVPPFAGEVYRDLLRRFGPMFQGLLVKKTALERIGLLDEAIISYQEWDTSIRLARHYTFGFVETPTFIYYSHGGETISKDGLREAQGYEQVFNKHKDDIFRFLCRKDLALHYRLIAKLYERAGKTNEARKFLLLALFKWPFGRVLLQVGLYAWRRFNALTFCR